MASVFAHPLSHTLDEPALLSGRSRLGDTKRFNQWLAGGLLVSGSGLVKSVESTKHSIAAYLLQQHLHAYVAADWNTHVDREDTLESLPSSGELHILDLCLCRLVCFGGVTSE
jgi:hypothetical protein